MKVVASKKNTYCGFGKNDIIGAKKRMTLFGSRVIHNVMKPK